MKIFYSDVPFLDVWNMILICVMYPGRLKFSGFQYRNGSFIQPECWIHTCLSMQCACGLS